MGDFIFVNMSCEMCMLGVSVIGVVLRFDSLSVIWFL